MDRMKTFTKYLLMVVVFYFVSNGLIYLALRGTYKPMKVNIVDESPKIEISEAKSTSINGYVKGVVKNESLVDIDYTYLKMDFYSERDVLMGSKYVRFDNLKYGEDKEFDMGFKYKNVKKCTLSFTKEEGKIEEQELISEKEAKWLLIIGLGVLLVM